ncbi:NAD(P)H-hydrate dehydratase [Epibacterium ulvae]|uniref:NAD(P)H-hydrate dehydratase n=1 Tax=Epibacterium ulvae TaxID=1156985 RepID=UPI002492C703|nr:NAD(P)H-hydrate dehydratase [Epibacterium ulvae]
MPELLTAAQMRAIEQAAIKSGAVTGLELMERAGSGVVEAIFEEWPELAQPFSADNTSTQSVKRAVILCGPGNNGGDGFVVARRLHELGWCVKVFLYGDAESLPTDARVNYDRWLELGVVDDASDLIGWTGVSPQLIIDALFGTGLSRVMSEELMKIHRYIAIHALPKIVAVDSVSGFDMDSGRFLGSGPLLYEPIADLVVAFHRAKCGHLLAHAPDYISKLRVIDIGLDDFETESEPIQLIDLEETLYPLSKAQQESPGRHKFSYGHALVLTGGAGKTGAGRLAARGALRIGAGLVTLGVPPCAQIEVACQITSLMLTRVERAEGLAKTLEDARINALCLGPGLGQDRARDLLPVALRDPKRAVVLDADALSAFADQPEALFAMLHENCVLTPHGGEFARLFPDLAEKLNSSTTRGSAYSKVDATRDAAKRAGCIVLFKGPDTVIAAPDGACSIHAAAYNRAAPWLATAGAGDVLAGFITGLLARGFAPMHAAEAAAWLHVECARQFGPGLIAEDLPEQLPKVLADLS